MPCATKEDENIQRRGKRRVEDKWFEVEYRCAIFPDKPDCTNKRQRTVANGIKIVRQFPGKLDCII